MRLTVGWRANRLFALVVVSAVAAAGCDNKPKGTAPGDTTSPTASDPAPRKIVEAHLDALTQGTVTPNQLTANFRNALSRPKAEADAEAREYLAQFKGARFSILEETAFGNAVVVRGRVESPEWKEAFTLRMVKEDDGYKTDWLHRSGRMGMNIKSPADADLAAAQDTARNFIDIILGGDVRMAIALMTPEWKVKLAPPNPADIRDGYDYSPGFLTQTTRWWKGDTVGYELIRADLGETKKVAGIWFALEQRGVKIPFVVTASKVGNQWLIAGFDQRKPPEANNP